jgi:uracil phosphoribosyltransferase
MVRDESTLQPTIYASRMPTSLTGRAVFVLDPMLATGGTLAATVRLMLDRGAARVTCITLLAAPEGIDAMQAALGDEATPVTVVTAALDERLNEKGYIVPGLGDAGDRLYGSVGG